MTREIDYESLEKRFDSIRDRPEREARDSNTEEVYQEAVEFMRGYLKREHGLDITKKQIEDIKNMYIDVLQCYMGQRS